MDLNGECVFRTLIAVAKLSPARYTNNTFPTVMRRVLVFLTLASSGCYYSFLLSELMGKIGLLWSF